MRGPYGDEVVTVEDGPKADFASEPLQHGEVVVLPVDPHRNVHVVGTQ